ncbi:MAG: hypothetical protein H6838_07365 [Planctomycetes bacterium]|nr:hypothetical protein [Planctomycetota bacterium]MCB9885293.1 hypothetical protein [Planctomycetota bacterium]
MNRRDFVRITGGVLAALHARGVGPCAAAPRRTDPDLLAAGLTAMARASGWFEAHWGAALLAGHYLVLDPALDAATARAIRDELDLVLVHRADQVRPFPAAAADPRAVEQVARSLAPALTGGLRAHGHAAIYTALALRALRDAPHLAIAAITDRLVGWNRTIARKVPTAPRAEPAPRPREQLAARTLSRLRDFAPLVGLPRLPRPNFTHWVTHTEALLRLAALGHVELAELGQPGLQAHLEYEVPDVGDSIAVDRAAVSFANMLAPDYWRDESHRAAWHRSWNERDSRNGDWIASGHLFKLLYAFTDLARAVDDRELVERSAVVLFERYFDPEVGGG